MRLVWCQWPTLAAAFWALKYARRGCASSLTSTGTYDAVCGRICIYSHGAAIDVDLELLAETEAYLEPKCKVMVIGDVECADNGHIYLRAILLLRVPELDLAAWEVHASQLAAAHP